MGSAAKNGVTGWLMTCGHRVTIMMRVFTPAKFSPKDSRQCCYVCVCVYEAWCVCVHECQSTRHSEYDSGVLCAQDFLGGTVTTGHSMGQGLESVLGTAVRPVPSPVAGTLHPARIW